MAGMEGQSGSFGGSGGGPSDTMIGRVLGEFEIIREVGRGGMGTVYEARQKSLNRRVALKVLRESGCLTETAILRFRREAQAAAKLQHPHIVGVYAQGEHDGLYYYAMEFVDGRPLIDIINDARGGGAQSGTDVTRTMPQSAVASTPGIEETVMMDSANRPVIPRSDLSATTQEQFDSMTAHLASIADALAYAHREGVIHRDIKPHNCVLGNDGVMQVTDFGLARIQEQPGVTMTGEFLGSPLYMSPEQITGDASKIDHRTDIYSLGATMYEWMTLSPPFPGETRAQVISKIISSEVSAPRHHNPMIPTDLETVCLKAIDKDVSRRYESADEMAEDLRRYLKRRSIVARRESVFSRMFRFISRNRVEAGILAILVTAAMVIVYVQSRKFNAERIVKQEEIKQAEQEQEQLQTRVDELEAERTTIMDALQQNAPIEWELAAKGAGAMSEVIKSAMSTFQPKATSDEVATFPLPASFADYTDADRSLVAALMDEFTQMLRDESDLQTAIGGRRDQAFQAATDYFRQALDSTDPQRAFDFVNESFGTGLPETGAWQLRTILLIRRGDFSAAMEDVSFLIQFNPERPAAYVLRGLIRLLADNGKNASESIEDFNKAINMDPKVSGFYVARAFAHARLAEFSRSNDDLGRAEQLSSGHVAARLERLRMRERVQETILAISDAIKISEAPYELLVRRGDLHAMLHELKDALADYKQAIMHRSVPPADLLARLTFATQEMDMRKKSSKGNTEETDAGELVVPDWIRTLVR